MLGCDNIGDELARELGVSNKDVLDLCDALGVGVKSHSSSIVEPQAQVTAGYQNVMPSYQGTLSEAQIVALIAYMRSLPGSRGVAK